MALSETQLSGLKKTAAPITNEDLSRVLTALGLKRTPGSDDGTQGFSMKIDGTWTAAAKATEAPSDTSKKAWRLDLFVQRAAGGQRLGPVYRTEDLFVLQRKGASIMAEMFASVDDLSVFACPSCEGGLLTWDDQKGTRTTKAGMACTSCDWKGHTAKFQPYRELR